MYMDILRVCPLTDMRKVYRTDTESAFKELESTSKQMAHSRVSRLWSVGEVHVANREGRKNCVHIIHSTTIVGSFQADL